MSAPEFKQTKIDYSKSIAPNEYGKGGLLNTMDLASLPEDFDGAFILPPIEYTKEIRNVLVIYNPASGGGKGSKLVKEYIIPKLESCKIEAYVLMSEGPKFITKYLIQQKEKILSLKINAFIIVGGDGTYHEFINGYICGGWMTENIPVLFACGGTGNALCSNCGINNETDFKKLLDTFCKQIEVNKPIHIQYMDCIEIHSMTKPEKIEEKEVDAGKSDIVYVCSQAYWGLPAAAGTTAESLRFCGGYRYNVAALYQIVRKDARKIKVTFFFDETEENAMRIDLDICVLVMMKNKYVGKGLMIAPLAKLDNGLLEIVILPNVSRRQTLRLFSLLPKGSHILNTSEEVGPFFFRCKKVILEPYEGCHDEIGVDGEKGPNTPFMLKVLPKAIPMIV